MNRYDKPFFDLVANVDLSPDLDWMLQSHQLDDAALCEALIEACADELAWFCLDLTGNNDKAGNLVLWAISRAVVERRRFWGQASGRAWLYALLLKGARKVMKRPVLNKMVRSGLDEILLGDLEGKVERDFLDTLDDFQVWLMTLYYGCQFSLEEIAFILNHPAEKVRMSLQGLQAGLLSAGVRRPGVSAIGNELPDLEDGLRRVFRPTAITPGSGLDAVGLDADQLAGMVLQQVSAGRRAINLWSRAKQIVLFVGLAAIVFLGVWGRAWLMGEPPANFDYTKHPLEFKHPQAGSGASGSSMTVFAGGYFLGELPLDDDTVMSCRRSPDGRRIVYNHVLDGRDDSRPALFWADLAALGRTHPIAYSNGLAGSFAFSPDGRTLAYFGCEIEPEKCGAYLLDFATGRAKPLVRAGYVDYLLWKPDGTQLAMLKSNRHSTAWRYTVFRLPGKEVLYEGAFNWRQRRPAPDAPIWEWEVSHPVQVSGLDGCQN